MSNTREALKALGSSDQSEEALVERGLNTLRDRIAATLRDNGITEAVGFEVTLVNGEEFTVLSPANPRMSTPASEVASVTPRQSAKAGSWASLLG